MAPSCISRCSLSPSYGCSRARSSLNAMPSPGPFGQRDESVVPVQCVADHASMEIAPGLNCFSNQQIWNRRSQLNVGGPLDRAGVEMRCDLGIEDLRDRRNLLPFQECHLRGPAPAGRSIRLQSSALPRIRTSSSVARRLRPGSRQPMRPARNSSGLSGGTGSSNQSGSNISNRRPRANRSRRRELSMRSDQKICPGPDCIANSAAKRGRSLDVEHGWLMAAADRVRACRIEFDPR